MNGKKKSKAMKKNEIEENKKKEAKQIINRKGNRKRIR